MLAFLSFARRFKFGSNREINPTRRETETQKRCLHPGRRRGLRFGRLDSDPNHVLLYKSQDELFLHTYLPSPTTHTSLTLTHTQTSHCLSSHLAPLSLVVAIRIPEYP